MGEVVAAIAGQQEGLRSSRRADWRFLLPEMPRGQALCVGSPHPDVVLELSRACEGLALAPCEGAERAFSAAVEARLDNVYVLNPSEPARARYDLIAAFGRADAGPGRGPEWSGWSIERLAAYAPDGAQLYLEVDRPALWLPPARLAARLRRLGFGGVSAYWPKPSFERCEMLLPLRDSRLQRYYLDTLFFGLTHRRQALRAALRLLTRLGLFELSLPAYALVARRAASGRAAPATLQLLQSEWQAHPPRERLRGTPLRWLVLNGGLSERSKLVCPTWVGSDELPSLVVKFPRCGAHNGRLAAEYGALEILQRYMPPGSPTAPVPVAELDLHGRHVTVETALPGKPLNIYIHEHRQQATETLGRWRAFARWLADVHSRSARAATGGALLDSLVSPLERAERELDLRAAIRQKLRLLQSEVRGLVAESPPELVFNHNDAGPPNLICGPRGEYAGAIDWEGARFGPPAMDLIYFLDRFAQLALAEGTGDELRGLRETFFGNGSWSTTARSWLVEYCGRVGLPERWLPPIFAVCWATHALSEQEHRHGHTSPAGSPGARGRSVSPTHFRKHLVYYLENTQAFIFAPERGAAGAGQE